MYEFKGIIEKICFCLQENSTLVHLKNGEILIIDGTYDKEFFYLNMPVIITFDCDNNLLAITPDKYTYNQSLFRK